MEGYVFANFYFLKARNSTEHMEVVVENNKCISALMLAPSLDVDSCFSFLQASY